MASRHDPAQARPVWPPAPGFFRLRLIAGGWPVPARIIQHADGAWQAEIDGSPLAPDTDPARAQGVARVWHSGFRTDEADFRWLLAVKEHAARTDPDHPALHPRKAINPRLLRPLIPRTES